MSIVRGYVYSVIVEKWGKNMDGINLSNLRFAVKMKCVSEFEISTVQWKCVWDEKDDQWAQQRKCKGWYENKYGEDKHNV